MSLRIDPNQPHQLRYWTRELDVCELQLRDAIATVGDVAVDVRVHFHGPLRRHARPPLPGPV